MLTQIILLLLSGAAPPDHEEAQMRCGAYCLYVSLKALDVPVESYGELEARLGPVDPAGYSMQRLASTARQYGVNVLGVASTPENLARRKRPFACIAHFRGNHFAIIADIANGVATVVEPPRQFQVPVDTLRRTWGGKALLLSRAPLTPEEDLSRPGYALYAATLLASLAMLAGTAVVLRHLRKERG